MTSIPASLSHRRIPRSDGRAWQMEIYGTLGSTSDTCKARLDAGKGVDGLAILALSQTAGRGSRGRQWADPGGNLALSVMLVGQGTEVPVGLWPFIAGLAMHDAMADYLPANHALQLKWPNDLLLAGRKMAGILIEAGTCATGARWQVIGMGANLRHAPAIAGRELACLADATPDVPGAPDMACAVLRHLDRWLGCYVSYGFGAVRAAWLERGHPVGTAVNVTAGNRQFSGTFAGLADDGTLLLQTPHGLCHVVTGEVMVARTG
ncbi:biotin--[acetyl-CoA-carboxylase] ligase [Komagataeibacter medellinensis]|uniref:biotin--[biotin carboxyl-carrier protein] ligase n=1 Tax=Komagataeibacter medellinensis (strain NBRC 3288 / BCRC 11682 / LMG 1693 / Kondo 51) TaxID=634177 RepID=G2I579_KOMMN|nr:biotin--[acetyl-CoA-carboxylase] ligase [Komagataeibacter medellinensis]BAK83276.1 biotin--acetyl-CoA-carboxylase ligase [Komagataeibacter medellinensis NBRC 3288]